MASWHRPPMQKLSIGEAPYLLVIYLPILLLVQGLALFEWLRHQPLTSRMPLGPHVALQMVTWLCTVRALWEGGEQA